MRKFHQDNSEIDLGIFSTRGLMLREDYCKEDYNMNKIQNDDVTNIMKYKGDHNTNKVKIRQLGRHIVYTCSTQLCNKSQCTYRCSDPRHLRKKKKQ